MYEHHSFNPLQNGERDGAKKLCVNQALFVLEQKIFNVKSSLSCCHLVDATSQRSRIRPRLL